MVVAWLFGPFDNFVKVSNPNFDGLVFRGEYRNTDSVALAHEFVLGGSSIICANPNEIRKKMLLAQVDFTGDDHSPHQRAIMAGMALGSTQFVRELIEHDENLNAAPASTNTKTDAFGDYHPKDQTQDDMEGWLQELGQIEAEEETTILNHLKQEAQWDTWEFIHFSYSFDKSGNNVVPAPPTPDYLHEIQGKLQRRLHINDINKTLNQFSAYDYAPSVGVSSHIDQPCLGPVIATANLLSDVTISEMDPQSSSTG